MKKLIFVTAGLMLITSIHAQSLAEIVTKYTIANKLDKISSLKTVKITGNMSMMGMDMPLVMWMKNPNKIKSVTTINGQEMIQVYDGVNGYTINPMTGSATPVAMTPDQVKQTMRSNIFQNYMAAYLKDGQLALAGEDNVNNKPAYKIKATVEGGTIIDLFIDKNSYLLVKTSATTSESGTTMIIDSFPSEYTETNGFLIPMKTTTTAQGMEFILNFTKVEVDIPMDDNVFKVN
jgi:hypothetical protein